MERATGIEPAWPAWKAGDLPLSYTRIYGDTYRTRTHVIAVKGQRLNQLDQRAIMELTRGIEPPTCWLQVSCSTYWATPAYKTDSIFLSWLKYIRFIYLYTFYKNNIAFQFIYLLSNFYILIYKYYKPYQSQYQFKILYFIITDLRNHYI